MTDRRRSFATEDTAGSVLSEHWLLALQRVGDVRFVADEPRRAAQRIVDAAVAGRSAGEHIHLANAYSVALSSTDEQMREALTGPRAWALPDGRPLAWLSALRQDRPRLRQVRGPQLMLDVADLGRTVGLKHYLLGGAPEVLADLQANLQQRFPGIEVVGTCSPPFRPASPDELLQRDAAIAASGAQIVWVGLGTPKQDFEAVRLTDSLTVVAIAVGAAFDYAAGALRPAPHWISSIGMEWAWRFAAEPRRLWRRYTIGNAQFLRAVATSELRRVRHRSSRRPRRVAARSAVVVGRLPPPLHGSAVMTQRLVDALQSMGLPVAVVDRRFSGDAAAAGTTGLRTLSAVPSLLLRFLRVSAARGPLVVLIATRPGPFLLDVLLLALARRPAVLYVRTGGFRALAARGRIWSALVRRSLRRADRVVALGPALVDDLQPFVDAGAVAVIPDATPGVAPSPRRAGANVLFLADLLPGNGADVFVRLAAAVQRARPGIAWRFDLAGAGDPAPLAPLPGRTTVHGPVGGAPKERLLRAADVLVVPSTGGMEALPLVAIEALAHGVPVVAYDHGGIRDLLDPSVGVLVTRGDEEALQQAVIALVESPDRAARMSRAAVRRHRLRYSLPVYAEGWRSVLGLPVAPDRAVPTTTGSGPALTPSTS